MQTFVLVHGSWHGSWCWQAVARMLRDSGSEVHTPNLSGCGASAHLLESGAAIDLQTHIDDVVGTLVHEDLHEVVLVGHSYAGLVVAGAWARCPGRVRLCILLDAYVLGQGQTGLSCWDEDQAAAARRAIALGEKFRLPPDPRVLGINNPETAAWAAARMKPHPLACYDQALDPAVEWNAMPSVYVRCTEGPIVQAYASSERMAVSRGWPVVTLATGHDAMLTAPPLTTRLLAELASTY